MKKLAISGLIVMMFLACGVAQAAMVTLNIDQPFSYTGTAPTGSITATFTDITGGVQLKIDNNLSAGESIDELYFNINPSKDSILKSLIFTLVTNNSKIEAATVPTSSADKFSADGGGYYDINLSYSTSLKDFLPGVSQTYTISGAGITASDFTNFLSEPHGGNGTWLAAAHVQGNGVSAWVGAADPVPVPAAAWLFGSGLLGLFAFKRKSKG